MFAHTRIFTVHERAAAPDPAERILLVREGFCWGAFVFHLFWLCYHRLWLAASLYLGLLVALGAAEEGLGLPATSLGALQLLLQLLLGYAGHDLKRHALTRKGYTLIGVVSGDSAITAERRYYDAIA